VLGKHAAAFAVANALYRFAQRRRQSGSAIAVTLQQVKGDTLRRLLSDTGHTAQRIDHLDQQW
jgi:hypothetical protein